MEFSPQKQKKQRQKQLAAGKLVTTHMGNWKIWCLFFLMSFPFILCYVLLLKWYNMNGRSQMQGGKKGILPKDMGKCKSVFLRLSFARNHHLRYVPLWDRMEGAWLLTLFTFCLLSLVTILPSDPTPCVVYSLNRNCQKYCQYLAV